MIVTAGSTDVSVYYYIVQDASGTSPGEPVTGLLFSDIETGGSASYARQGAARVDLTLITLASASAAHADGGFILVDDTNMPGLYRCDYPDAAFATGVDQVFTSIVVASANNAVAAPVKIEITDVDLRDAVRGGMTALPNAAADAGGGLPISDAGGLDLDTQLAATNEVTAARMGALTDWINGGRLDLLLDAIKVPTDKMVFTVANQLDSNVLSISGDGSAADNLELMYDGSGYTDDTAPASRSQVSQIANVGAAIHVSAIAAPNGFTLTTGSEVNDEDATIPLDGVRHELTDAAGTLDALYKFNIGGDAAPVSVTFTGVYNGNGDDFIIEGNTGTDATPVWVQIGTLGGTNSSSNVVHTFTMFSNMIVTDVAGQVQVRVSGTGLTSSSFDTDQVLVSKSSTSRSVGYAAGAIWVNTGLSNTSTEVFVDGVADNPVSTWAAALTLSASLGLTDFHIINGSTIQLSATSDNFSLFGDNWTLDLNGQSIAGAHFQGAIASGTGTGATRPEFDGCELGTCTLVPFVASNSGLNGTITFSAAGNYELTDCHSSVAGPTTPVIDTGAAVANVNLTMPDYNQGIEIRNLNNLGTDEFSISGKGQIIYAASSSGTVHQRGAWKVTNTGGVTITADDNSTNIAAVLVDTGTTLDTKLNDIQGATFSTGTDSLEAIRDRGDAAWTTGAGGSDRLLMVDTTIATLATQVSFTLTAGSADNDAYNNLSIVIEDVSTATQKAVGVVLDYVGSTKTVTLKEALSFTIAATDKVYILAENSLKSTVANRQLDVTSTGAAGIDWGNMENKTTANDLSGTDIQLVDTATTLTNKTGFSLSATGLDAIVSTATGMVEIAKAIWDRLLTGATHNITNSAGKRVRDVIDSVVLSSDTAQGGTLNTITLAAAEPSVDGTYDPSTVTIVGGVGVGQSRLILQYEGSTRIATVDRNWKVTPDGTAIYTITSNAGREHVNEGLAQAATATTITLNALASSLDDAYIDQTIFIRSGTGDDQARVVTDYNGTTKVATVASAWGANPDTTSGYVMLPTSLATNIGTPDVNVIQIDGSAEAASDLKASALTIVVAAATATTLTTTTMSTNLTEATDDHYNGRIIIWTSGVLKDQATDITDYTGATKLLTFTATTEAPGNGDSFVVV
jgi:hypothetical protein